MESWRRGAGAVVTVWDSSLLYKRRCYGNGTVMECEVPRSSLTVSAVSDGWDPLLADGRLTVPYGKMPDSLYATRCVVDTRGEVASLRLVPRKQFVSVTFDVGGAFDALRGLSLEVHSGVCGIDIKDMSAVRGDLFFRVGADSAGVFSFLLPRIPDGVVEMRVLTPEGRSYPVDLGGKMRSAGFDWAAEDLSDIELKTGKTPAEVSVRVVPWERQLLGDKEI